MQLPAKMKNGDQLRSVAVDTINSLIDYLASTRIVQGMGIRLQQYAHGTVVSAAPVIPVAASGISGVSAYNGYFTLKDVSTYNEDGTVKEFRVAVCDGETWDPVTETSGPMLLRVNYATISVPCCILSDLVNQQGQYIYLVYTNSTRQVAFQVSGSQFDNFDVYYYLIGEFSQKGSIIQRHISGIGNGEAQIWPITSSCGV